MTQGSNSIADDILRNGFDRWQRLEGEKQAISDDLKELFQELKGNGFDGKALRAAFRKVAKIGDTDVQELNAVVDLYVDSLTAPRVGTVPATHIRAAREVKPDPIAALKADPALAIVAASEIKIPQPTKAAGSDLTTSQPLNGQVADIPEAKASKDSGATEPDIETPADSVTGDVSRLAAGRTADVAGNELPASNAGQQGDEQPESVTAGETAPLYPEPGVVYWESAPPEGVERHEYSAAFGTIGQDIAVIEDDLARSKAEPIVKMGNVILDGWARYMAARGMVGLDGKPVEYSVVQYDGRDPLLDCIRWNLAGRILTEDQKRIICAKLVKLYPQRKGPIWGAFEFGMELV